MLLELGVQRSFLIQLEETFNIVSHIIAFDVVKHLVKVTICIKDGDCQSF